MTTKNAVFDKISFQQDGAKHHETQETIDLFLTRLEEHDLLLNNNMTIGHHNLVDGSFWLLKNRCKLLVDR